TRSQMQNRKLAEEKALQIIFSALKVIRRRHQTQASKSSKERRLTTKKALSRKKQFRKKPELE
ncbi:MAG: aminoacyl-tRNA hydrolase, partial [Spirochaetes bacterium]